jgi:hypothetical protein
MPGKVSFIVLDSILEGWNHLLCFSDQRKPLWSHPAGPIDTLPPHPPLTGWPEMPQPLPLFDPRHAFDVIGLRIRLAESFNKSITPKLSVILG